MTAPGRPATREDGAPHAVALYDSEESLRARVVPYLREGLDRGETVVAVVSEAAEQIVRSALGGDADRVQWRAGEVSYDRLGAMFEGFRQFLADQRAAGVAMRLLTQNDVAGGPDRILIFGERPLRTVLARYSVHYNGRRPHRALRLRPPHPDHLAPHLEHQQIRRRPVLGGLTNEYERAA